jgi:hypothetical protein
LDFYRDASDRLRTASELQLPLFRTLLLAYRFGTIS